MSMKFTATHTIFCCVLEFGVDDAPAWLTSQGTVPGSTMDMRWFWTDYVLKLQVGESVKTEFHEITRVA